MLALNLPFPVLDHGRHELVLEWVTTALLTALGVRTLAPDDPYYHARYGGNAPSREDGSAPLYHGADVSLWFVNAVHQYLRSGGDEALDRRQFYEPGVRIIDHLAGPGTGQLPELFGGSAPHLPGGAPASALSVVELLRCYAEDVADDLLTEGTSSLTLAIGDLSTVIPAPPATPKT